MVPYAIMYTGTVVWIWNMHIYGIEKVVDGSRFSPSLLCVCVRECDNGLSGAREDATVMMKRRLAKRRC